MKRGLGLFNRTVAQKAGLVVLRAGGFLLADQLYQHYKLKRKMTDQNMLPTKDQREAHNIVEATKKEWLIFGRQSPGYVRDPNAQSKDHLQHKIEMSSIIIKQLGAFLDNEEHYNLFENSDFQVTLFSSDPNAPQIAVDHSKLASTELDDIPDDARFEIGFARKQGFTDITTQIPLFHSSIALRIIPDGQPGNDNVVIMTGKEIKAAIAETNKVICDKQHCTMLTSNCYTASVFTMGELIKIIDARDDTAEKKAIAIKNILPVLSSATLDNYSVGVSNNGEVSRELSQVTNIALKHHLVTMQNPEEGQSKLKM